MIDEYDAKKIAEEATIAMKALDRLIYCGMRGGFDDDFADEKIRTVELCIARIRDFREMIRGKVYKPRTCKSKFDHAEIVRLYEELKSPTKVAEVIGCSPDTVWRVVKNGRRCTMYECFHCGNRSVIWDSDFDLKGCGYECDGVVHVLHCANCGAEIQYTIGGDDGSDGGAVSDETGKDREEHKAEA